MNILKWFFGKGEGTKHDHVQFLREQHEAMADLEEFMAEAKNRHAEAILAAYNKQCEDYKQECKEMYDGCIANGMTEIESMMTCIQSGYGPRIYNPPVAGMVKYIVDR